MAEAGRISLVTVGAMATLALAACGSTVQLPEAPSGAPLTTASVNDHVSQTGNAQATIDQSSVMFKIDNSGSLVLKFQLTSTASAAQTIEVRASLYDGSMMVIGDATGGAVNVDPGSTTEFQLNGNAPDGTIASVTFEVTAQGSPTPFPTPTAA